MPALLWSSNCHAESIQSEAPFSVSKISGMDRLRRSARAVSLRFVARSQRLGGGKVKRDRSKPVRAPERVMSPGPNTGPYLKEIRVKLTEQQYAHLQMIKGSDRVTDYVRDRLFYASPSDAPHVAAIGAVFQAANHTIAVADELLFQIRRMARTVGSLASIAKREPRAVANLPAPILWPVGPVEEYAYYLEETGSDLRSLATRMADMNLAHVLDRKRTRSIKTRVRGAK